MKIRADVMHDPCPTLTGTEAPDHARQCSAECRSTMWTASVQVTGGPHRRYRSQWCASWPEAMQAAYKLLADLDAELMNEVHASRSSRHAAKNERLKAETIV